MQRIKTKRQNRAVEKKRYDLWLDLRNYSYLDQQAKERGISIAALLNLIVSGVRNQ
jgi:hypothetical protein